MRGRDAFEKTQRKLYRAMREELRHLDEAKGPEIRAYESTYQNSLKIEAKPTRKAALLNACAKARVVLVGDFHSFRQSQKGFLRLLKETKGASVIALECVQSRFQSAIDHFSQGLITAEEMREEVHFDHYWPFAWESYREIFLHARSHGIPLLALNVQPAGASGHLRQRDEAAAGKIAAFAEEFPAATVFTLYGELHLAAPHLPRLLKKKLSAAPVVVHQNEPLLYWRAPRLKNGDRPEVLKLRKNEFCLLTSVPWIKLRSYLDWAEGGSDDDWESESDPAGALVHFGSHLAELLHLPRPDADAVEIIGPEALGNRAYLPQTKDERDLLRHARERLRVSFLPSHRRLLLPSVSTNALTEAGAILLWAQANGREFAGARGSSLLVQFLAGYLGSKFLNPKRKCNEVADMRIYLDRVPAARRLRDPKFQVFSRALALLDQHLFGKRARGTALAGPKEIEAHRLAGYVLGNRLFLRWRRKEATISLVREVFSAPTSREKEAKQLLRKILAELRLAPGAAPAKSDSF